MNNFQQFNIKPASNCFEGDKIKIAKMINKSIIIEAFKIEESKYKDKGNGKCLYLQIIVDNDKRVLFTGSASLQEMIQRVPEGGFPFTTTIIKENERYQFT